jgi:hypothetical protein
MFREIFGLVTMGVLDSRQYLKLRIVLFMAASETKKRTWQKQIAFFKNRKPCAMVHHGPSWSIMVHHDPSFHPTLLFLQMEENSQLQVCTARGPLAIFACI